MIFGSPGKATQIKYAVYLFSATLLGVILSFMAHAGIEVLYLNWAQGAGYNVVWHGGCALPASLNIGLLAAGAFGGLALGRWWWRKLYIERVWENRSVVK